MTDRVVIVTGGFGVLGQAVAEAFVAQGDIAVRVDFARVAPDANRAAPDIGGTDLTDPESVARVVEMVRESCGAIDALITSLAVLFGKLWVRRIPTVGSACSR